MDPNEIGEEMRRAQAEFQQLIATASRLNLGRTTNGTRWTNWQLLFHMVLGYGVVRTLLPLVRMLGRLGYSRGFAATLNAGYRPFQAINYLGPCLAARLLSPRVMTVLLDAVIASLRRRLATEAEEPGPEHARADGLGPLLHPDDERARRLPLRDPALRPPSAPAHHRGTASPVVIPGTQCMAVL